MLRACPEEIEGVNSIEERCDFLVRPVALPGVPRYNLYRKRRRAMFGEWPKLTIYAKDL